MFKLSTVTKPEIIVFAMLALCCVAMALSDTPKVGHIGEEKPADDIVRGILKDLHKEVEIKAGRSFEKLTPIVYKTQVVSGMNYFIKTEATEKNGAKSILHVRVWRPFRGDHQLSAVRSGLGQQDPIEYFQ